MKLPSYEVLIVDDDPAAVRLIAKIVEKAGHVARIASDGCAAMDQIRSRCPDLVISDWEMPGMDGLALCRAIRSLPLPKYVGVVLLTARSADAEMVEGLESGADDFFSKPIKPHVLVARLHAAMRILEMERRLRKASQRDPLTGLLNRRAMHEQLIREWTRDSHETRPLSCVMFDLDFFKRINDANGHAAGDAVLRAVADVLGQNDRPGVTCRYGGEEFCAILPGMCEAEAVDWAESVRSELAQLTLTIQGRDIGVKGSFGVAQRTAGIAGPESLLGWADEALAVAKQTGRNRVVSHSAIDDPDRDLGGHAASDAPLDGVLTRDVMHPADISPHVDDAISTVADLLLQTRLNSAPVVDSDGNLVGIISEIDLARAAVSGHNWSDPIRDVFVREVVTFDEESSAREVFDFLSRASVRRVVVVNNGKPSGVISRTSLVRWLRNRFAVPRPSQPQATERLGVCTSRKQVSEMLSCVQRRIGDLCEQLDDETVDSVPGTVAEASRLQELADDLLRVSSTQYGTGVS